MKKIVYNYDNLNDSNIDEIVIRTKGLIVNKNNEILLGYSDNTYQFPGGHLEKGETLESCIIREIKEETGIDIGNNDLNLFYKITHYTKNYHNTDKNRKNEIYYYIINTKKEPNIYKMNLDEHEIKDNYTLKKIPLSNVETVLLDSIQDKSNNKIIVNEMINVLNEYKRINRN